ncbi:MAG TPA: biotin transporter BioY [Candidatus Limnocylindrales bacterium]|jgi:biotin transport system substrate-specific component|nr:biotin transporter BioY [Candidatus Limnocylindrales bacterium]
MTLTLDGRAPVLGSTLADGLVPAVLATRLGSRSRDVALVAAGALLIALSAAVSVRLPDNPVPITGQTFGVLVVAGALGLRRGLAATALYVAIGVIGFPAFAEGKGGLGVIAGVSDGRLVLGATGGYLLGFVLASALVGRLAERGWDRRLPGALAAMAVGNLAIYAIGLPWLATATSFSPAETIAKGLVPFLLGDGLKLLLAAGVLPAAWRVVGRGR